MDPELWLFAQTRGGLPRSRARMVSLIAALDIPEPEHVILVSGTNGKGTIATSLGHALNEAQVDVGVFTSPHVEKFNERISVNGELISDSDVRKYIAWLQANPAIVRTFTATFFELSLAIALRYFADRGVTHAVIEAGVGVQHDATNALNNFVMSIISNVSLDHTNVFGNSIAAIARDKAFATRRGMPTITGATDEALKIISDRAEAVGGQLYTLDEGDDSELFSAPPGTRPEVRLAAAAARLLALPDHAVSAVFTAPPLPARREVFKVGREKTVVLDGAHNIAAAERLLEELPDSYVLLFAALPKKDVTGLYELLSQRASKSYLTKASPYEEAWMGADAPFFEDPVRALEFVLANTEHGTTIVVAGSFYLAGALRPVLSGLEKWLKNL